MRFDQCRDALIVVGDGFDLGTDQTGGAGDVLTQQDRIEGRGELVGRPDFANLADLAASNWSFSSGLSGSWFCSSEIMSFRKSSRSTSFNDVVALVELFCWFDDKAENTFELAGICDMTRLPRVKCGYQGRSPTRSPRMVRRHGVARVVDAVRRSSRDDPCCWFCEACRSWAD